MALGKQNIKRLLVCLSALLATAAFIFPDYCAECIIIFLVPLYYASMSHNYKLSYKDGFLWGALFYGISFFDIYLLLIDKGFGIARFSAIFIIYCYGVLVSGAWFLLAQLLSSLCKTKSEISRVFCWGGSTLVHSLFIEYLFFSIFGIVQGNSLQHFALPLAIRSSWLWYIGYLGNNIFFCCIIVFSMTMSFALLRKNYRALCLCGLFCSSLMFIAHYFDCPNNTSSWHAKIGCIIKKTDSSYPVDAIERIGIALQDFEEAFPHLCLVILPESTCKFPLNRYEREITLWDCSTKTIFLGAHRYEDGKLYNTLYSIERGKIKEYYDKVTGMFFTENVPSLWSTVPGSSDLFLLKNQPFESGTCKKKTISTDLGTVYPLICSELFFCSKKIASDKTYVCIINDTWFAHEYISNLMLLHAKLVASTKKTSIIYCSYCHCKLITQAGICINLPTVLI